MGSLDLLPWQLETPLVDEKLADWASCAELPLAFANDVHPRLPSIYLKRGKGETEGGEEARRGCQYRCALLLDGRRLLATI